MPKHIIVKIQSVEQHHLTNDAPGGLSLGQQVDKLLEDMQQHRHNRRFPNKVVIDFNPPEELDRSQIDE
jgi:imidazoleglycerol phosphate dehydratase HisB